MGHSTRSLDDFTELLIHHGVGLLVDVRTVPASRRMPHFSKLALERSLPQSGIRYLHMPELGGLRKPKADSINTGWRNVSFRGYADYMQTDEFWAGIVRLMSLPIRPGRFAAGSPSPASGEGKAIMCAEALPWRCHRSLVSDALTLRGVEVRHVTTGAKPARHALTPFAQVQGGRITYPPPDTLAI
ncbi:MAG TPA: DUF488 domain-containing protein [Candidatus Dormibacteraeota bacterium]|nr:DUF488 domain-containing protein [Candidatus Dormibacteraeota bacterium]